MWQEEEQAAIIPTSVGDLRAVKCYKHLGAYLQGAAAQTVELTTRKQAGRTTTAALSRRLFSNPALPERTRATTARACVQTRTLHLAGLWDPLSPTDLRDVAAVVHGHEVQGVAHQRGLHEPQEEATT